MFMLKHWIMSCIVFVQYFGTHFIALLNAMNKDFVVFARKRKKSLILFSFYVRLSDGNERR